MESATLLRALASDPECSPSDLQELTALIERGPIGVGSKGTFSPDQPFESRPLCEHCGVPSECIVGRSLNEGTYLCYTCASNPLRKK